MAVIKESNSNNETGKITISNGDWQTLQKVTAAYALNDESDAIAFAIGILNKSNGQGVIIEMPEGRTKFVPAEKLRKPADQS